MSLAICDHAVQGRIQDLGLEGAKSSAVGARIEAPKAPRVYNGVVWGGVSRSPLGVGPGEGAPPLPRILFSFLGLKMPILVRSPAHLECLFLQRNTSRSRPVRLRTLTFQADCGLIKGAGVSAEEGTEHFLPWY